MRLERANRHRQRTCRAYLQELGIEIPSGQDQPLLRLPIVLKSAAHRADLLAASHERGLGASAMYPTAIHHIAELHAHFGDAGYPGAEALAARLVTLPTHEFVTAADRRELAALLDESTRAASVAATEKAVPSW